MTNSHVTTTTTDLSSLGVGESLLTTLRYAYCCSTFATYLLSGHVDGSTALAVMLSRETPRERLVKAHRERMRKWLKDTGHRRTAVLDDYYADRADEVELEDMSFEGRRKRGHQQKRSTFAKMADKVKAIDKKGASRSTPTSAPDEARRYKSREDRLRDLPDKYRTIESERYLDTLTGVKRQPDTPKRSIGGRASDTGMREDNLANESRQRRLANNSDVNTSRKLLEVPLNANLALSMAVSSKARMLKEAEANEGEYEGKGWLNEKFAFEKIPETEGTVYPEEKEYYKY